MFRSTRSEMGASKSTVDWYQSSTSTVNAQRTWAGSRAVWGVAQASSS